MRGQQEPWLRGTHTDLPAVIRGVVHALELSREDVDAACDGLRDEQMHARPADVASLAFHLRHIVGSLDRLLTYAEGRQLSAEQLAILKAEQEARGSRTELLEHFYRGIESAIQRVEAFSGADLERPRQVGRKALPTTVGGLLVHCADHTLRHTGQAVTTAKLIRAGLA
ncbi:MAG TPA: DinB family protein [Acidobacteriaceae bacterium]|nr:DinB family protein [Acidobacteriaceae bacterium]